MSLVKVKVHHFLTRKKQTLDGTQSDSRVHTNLTIIHNRLFKKKQSSQHLLKILGAPEKKNPIVAKQLAKPHTPTSTPPVESQYL